MIDREAVIDLLAARYFYSADDEAVQDAAGSACLETEAQLKSGADVTAYPVIALAAARANCLLALAHLKSGEFVTSFKAGDVSVTMSPQVLVQSAKDELEKAERAASGYLRDGGFAFMQVEL